MLSIGEQNRSDTARCRKMRAAAGTGIDFSVVDINNSYSFCGQHGFANVILVFVGFFILIVSDSFIGFFTQSAC